MWKLIIKIFIGILVVSLLACGYFFAVKFQKRFLLVKIYSNELFHGQAITLDGKKQILIAENFTNQATQDLQLGKVKLSYDFIHRGKIFPKVMISDFIEIDSKETFSLDLRDRRVNGMTLGEFDAKVQNLIQQLSINNDEYANLKLNFKLELINFKGEKKTAPATMLISKLTDGNFLAALNFDNYAIKSFIDIEKKLIFGEYSAFQKDFEFIDFNFGLPTLFQLNSNELIIGNFKYNAESKNVEFITGESKFPREATIKGSIFSLHGLSHGTIAWEYFNKNRWKVTLNDAVVVSPLRARLTDLVFSQDDEGFNGINFNGEIEFYHNAFKELIGFEQPRNSALLKHHLIGKWDLDTNCWELNRLEHSGYSPMIKAKYRNFDLLFNPNSFKLTGAGEKSENISFSYELTFDNAELKDSENYLIAYDGKLSGDCELKVGQDQTFEPFFKGSLKFGTVDGKYREFRYSANQLKLQFGEDRDDKNAESWQIALEKLSLHNPKYSKINLSDLTGYVKLFKSNNLDDLNTMIYLNLAGSSMQYGNIVIARPAAEGGLNLLPNFAVWKAFLELSADKFKQNSTEGEKIKAELIVDRSKKNTILSDGKLAIKLGKLNYKSFIDSTINNLSSVMQFNLESNSNKILNRQIRFEADSGDFMLTPRVKGKVGKLNFAWEYPDLYSGNAENFTLEGGEYKLFAPKAIGSLAINSRNGNFTLVNGLFNGNQPLNFCLNFDWSKFFSNQVLSLSNSSFSLGDISFNGLGGLLQADVKNEKFELTSAVDEFNCRNVQLENLHSMVTWMDKKLILKQLKGKLGEGRIELSDKSSDSELIINGGNVEFEKVLTFLKLPTNVISGGGKIEICFNKKDNQYILQKISLQSSNECRLKMKQFNEFAVADSTVKSDFAVMALSDFKSKYCEIEFIFAENGVFDVKVTAQGRPAELLPFEFDVGSGKLKRVKYSLFNLESTIKLDYKSIKL